MAKSLLRLQARDMRSKGMSVRTIANKLGVSKSTASLWSRDIILSIEQQETLRQHSVVGAERGRLLGAFKQKQARLKRIGEGNKIGKQLLGNVTTREFFTAGVALYWAEGNKMKQKIEFCNSDPKLVQFLIAWFRKFFQLSIIDFRCYVGINHIHKNREKTVKMYWSRITGIPISNFTKTSFKKSPNKKIYKNFDQHYGTLAVRISNPSRILFKTLGLIEALKNSKLPG